MPVEESLIYENGEDSRELHEEILRIVEEIIDYRKALGVVRCTYEITVESVLEAYRSGIFPLPHASGPCVDWLFPPQRGVLFFSEFRPPKSWRKIVSRSDWKVTIDQAFDEVVTSCRHYHALREGETWITPFYVQVYSRLHQLGCAHSVEVWDEGGALIGGLYGVVVEGIFSGESMFYRETGASKRALMALVQHLQSRGATWMDTQMVTPVFASVGARLIPAEEFQRLLLQTQALHLQLFP